MTAWTYRKKPVEIQAWCADTSDYDDLCALVAWCGGRAVDHGDAVIEIDTLEGTMTVTAGDYVIQGVQGEFYPCKPDIFFATYDTVN